MSSTVGLLTLPVEAGAANSRLADPTVRGLASFFAYALRLDLNTKLTALTGMAANACPDTNIYWWNPDTHFVRGSFPALYLWWPGASRVEAHTMLYSQRIRELMGLYVFEEVVAPNGLRSRSGLLSAVDASLAKASERGRYAGHTPLATGAYAGQSVAKALNLISWEYNGGQSGDMIAAIPEASAAQGGPAEGHVKSGYPSLRFRVTVSERITDESFADETDADLTFTVLSADENGDLANPLEILQRYEYAPHGPHDED